jgi:predicted nucleotidyltransferase
MLHAHPTERALKVATEIAFFIPTYLLLRRRGLDVMPSVLLAFLVSHNINFLLNCAVWETLICDLTLPGAGKGVLFNYLKGLRSRLSGRRSIMCAFVYGSISRSALHDSSDLDLVLVRRPGTRYAIASLAVLTFEKLRSLVSRIPLEAYVADNLSWLDRPREDETPLIIADPDNALRSGARAVQTIEEAEQQNGMPRKN